MNESEAEAPEETTFFLVDGVWKTLNDLAKLGLMTLHFAYRVRGPQFDARFWTVL